MLSGEETGTGTSTCSETGRPDESTEAAMAGACSREGSHREPLKNHAMTPVFRAIMAALNAH